MRVLLHQLLRHLPSEWVSALGSFMVRRSVPRSRPEIMRNAKANLRLHRPQASEAELDAMVQEFLDGVGRVMAEFAVVHRFMKEGRITLTGGVEPFRAVVGTRPFIALGVHTGNWELFAPVMQHLGVQLNSIVAPPADDYERAVVEEVRRAFGVNIILPDLNGIRQALRVLKNNGVVSMFPDEAREGHSMGPLFGRAPHDKGNLAIAAKLARKTGALMGVGHCTRIGPCRFEMHFGELFELPVREKDDLLADVMFLNDRIEPIVRAHIPRWYFLDDSIAPVGSSVPQA